jgi:hypothetical protein
MADVGRSFGESGAGRSPLSLRVSREKIPRAALLVLGDLCDPGSRDMSLNALGVGLDGLGAKLVLDPKAALRAEGYCRSCRKLYVESSRLVTGLSGYGWLISARPSGGLSSLLRL